MSSSARHTAELGEHGPFCTGQLTPRALPDARQATGSGKSLVYAAPTVQAVLDDARARALLLFPTKALARHRHRSRPRP